MRGNHVSRLLTLLTTAAVLLLGIPPATASSSPPNASFRNLRIYAASSHRPVVTWTIKLGADGRVQDKQPLDVPGASTAPVDVQSGRLLFRVREKGGSYAIWIRNRGGSTRRIADGWSAVFAPDGKSILINRISTRPTDDFGHSDLYLHRLDSGAETLLLSLQGDVTVNDAQFTLDGRYVWMTIENEGSGWLASLRLSNRHLHKYAYGQTPTDCTSIQMLPDGKTLLTPCQSEGDPQWRLVIFRLSDGRTFRSWLQDPNKTVDWIHGRLDAHHLLVSVHNTNFRHTLGSLDLRNHRVRVIANTHGLAMGVTESD